MSEYGERDIESQDDYYLKHISAMTSENLHSKTAIAAELAHRDMIIDQLQAEKDKAVLEERERIMSIVSKYLAYGGDGGRVAGLIANEIRRGE